MSPVALLFLCFVTHSLIHGAYGKRHHPSLAGYARHPLYGHGMSGKTEAEQIQRYNGDRNQDVNFVEVLRKYIKTNPKLIDQVLAEISPEDFNNGYETDDPWECPNPGPTLCSTESPPPSSDERAISGGNEIVASLRRKWKRFEQKLVDDPEQCEPCIGAHHDCNAYVCCLEESMGTVSARAYGEYSCNLPPRTLDLFLNRVQESHPDFVIYAGDSPPHTIWDETIQSQLNCSQTVADAMQRAFDENLRVYANIGNHEMYPTNLYSLRMDETKHMTEEFTRMWHRFGGFDISANATMAEMGYYTTTVPGHDKLRIMSINTNYDWYNMNVFNVLNQYTAENEQHQQWIIDTLTAAGANDEKVIVIGHCPVGGPDAHVRSARWWEDIAKAYSDVMILHVSGHTHRDHFKLSFDHDSMDAKSVNLVVASTTSNTNVNPTMRMYYLDPENGYSLVDFESFYLDVKTQNESMGVPPAITFSYSAMDAYGMQDLSPNSWKQLVFKFIDDDDLFQAYYRNIRSHARDTVCDYDCKVDIICNLWFGEMSEVDECKTLAPEPPPIEPPVTAAPGPGSGAMLSRSLCAIALGALIAVITN